jgi:DNA-binding NtrC family response regulator
VAEAFSPEDARRAVIDGEAPVLVLAADVSRSEWRALAMELCHAPHRPKIVLAAHPAADDLWAEALDLDCFDILTKPYATEEVIRLIHLAWNRWLSERKHQDTNQRPARAALRTLASAAQ